MKKLFRKAVTVAGSAALIGATVGMAAAASYPEPFTSNAAIVVGANAAPSDNIAAASIAADLDANAASSGSAVVTGGESFALDKSSDHFNFGDALNSVYSTLDNEDMSFLNDGTYDDGSIDEDYEQTITFSSKTLDLFTDNDYNNDEPTIGFRWTNGESILSYKMEYDSAINFTEMEDTDLPLFGAEYYVLSADSSTNTLELLDSAEKTVVAEGETVTVGDKTVTIEYISSTGVKFNVNGELTDKLADHESYELDDGTYVVVNEILYSDKDTGISKVEFSLGAGKMKLVSAEEIELNDEDVDGLTATFDKTGDQLTSITIAWASDDETYLTEEDAITMPAFGKLSLSFGGLDFESDSEKISLDNGETFTVNMGNYDLPLAWWNSSSSSALLGEEDYRLKIATAAKAGNYTGDGANTTALTGGIELAEDNRFLVTYAHTDLSSVETLYYEVNTVDNDSSGEIKVELKDLINDDDLEFTSIGDTEEQGEVTVTLLGCDESTAYLTFSESGSGDLKYNRAISEKGLVVTIPTDFASLTTSTTKALTFTEANDDEDLKAGTQFTVTMKATTNDKIHASTTNVSKEESSDDNYVGYVSSSLASKITTDESGDEYDFEIEYYGKEVTADVQITADGTVSTSSDAGVMTVKDSEVDTVSGKNLVVVGGSAINSVAAELLGGAYSEAAFTSATGVAAGEFLIESFDRAGKTALLVAGYNAADTEKAATYLLNNDVDTSVGMKMKGTSATEATVVTA